MSNERSRIFYAGEPSLKKASELFDDVKKNKKRKSLQKDDVNKYYQYCIQSLSDNKKKSTALAFSPTFALTEMRSCLLRHDWINLQRLFPLLLEFSSDRETIIWRYIFTIMLHSPMSSSAHLEEFLNSCIGCQNDNLNHVLDQFVTINSGKKKN